jgi:hypothetical protein
MRDKKSLIPDRMGLFSHWWEFLSKNKIACRRKLDAHQNRLPCMALYYRQ